MSRGAPAFSFRLPASRFPLPASGSGWKRLVLVLFGTVSRRPAQIDSRDGNRAGRRGVAGWFSVSRMCEVRLPSRAVVAGTVLRRARRRPVPRPHQSRRRASSIRGRRAAMDAQGRTPDQLARGDAGSSVGYLIMPPAGSGPAPTPPAATSSNPIASPATDAAPAGLSMYRHRSVERRHLQRRVRVAAAFAPDLRGYRECAVGAVISSAPVPTTRVSIVVFMHVDRGEQTARHTPDPAVLSWLLMRRGREPVPGSGFGVRGLRSGMLIPVFCGLALAATGCSPKKMGISRMADALSSTAQRFLPRQRSRIRPARRAVHLEDGRNAPRPAAVTSRAS